MALFRYSFRDMSFKDVIAVSHDHLSKIALFDVEPFENDRLHHIGMDMRLLPGLAAGRLWTSPSRATRTAAHVADGNDNVVLLMPADSPIVVSRKGHDDTVCRAGEAYVWAGDGPLSLACHADCSMLNLSLPRAALAPLVRNPNARMMSKLDSSSAHDLWLLRSYAAMLVRADALSPEAAHLAVAHVHSLLALLLGPDRDRTEAAARKGVRAARLHALKADIAANINRPLSAAEVALRHGVSPRYLRELFAGEETSFTDFVLNQRLARARHMLSDPALAGRTVAAIAYEVGFNDLSYFNRAFRRRFGMTPSDARAQHGP